WSAQEGTESDKTKRRANQLYQALAWTQVLHAPPTLARWRRPRSLGAFRLILLTPALLYAWIAWTDVPTRDIALLYGVNIHRKIWVEGVLWLFIAFLGCTAWLNSWVMSARWKAAFF